MRLLLVVGAIAATLRPAVAAAIAVAASASSASTEFRVFDDGTCTGTVLKNILIPNNYNQGGSCPTTTQHCVPISGFHSVLAGARDTTVSKGVGEFYIETYKTTDCSGDFVNNISDSTFPDCIGSAISSFTDVKALKLWTGLCAGLPPGRRREASSDE